MSTTLLATESKLGGSFYGFGKLGKTADYMSSKVATMNLFDQVISLIIGFLTVVAGLWFIFQFIIGALGWLSAGGDKTKVQEAQAKITQAIVGLAVVIAAIFLIDLIGALLGLNILSPGDYIIHIWG